MGKKRYYVGQAVGLLLLLLSLVLCASPVVSAVEDLAHYERVCSNPVIVTATVTHHDSYDDDGDTDYCSYVSYVVGGVWATTTTERNYDRVKKGNTVLSVFLPGQKNPLLHYDASGDAC